MQHGHAYDILYNIVKFWRLLWEIVIILASLMHAAHAITKEITTYFYYFYYADVVQTTPALISATIQIAATQSYGS